MRKPTWMGMAGLFGAVGVGVLLYQQMQIRKTLSEMQDNLGQDEVSLLMREDFQMAEAMRSSISETYAATGKMPTTNAEAGTYAPDQYHGKTLKSATVRVDGSIELVFDAKSGVDGGRIQMLPDLMRAQAMGVQWHCQTPDYPLIKRALPTCEYVSKAADVPATDAALHQASGK
jgi:hypothetical protein